MRTNVGTAIYTCNSVVSSSAPHSIRISVHWCCILQDLVVQVVVVPSSSSTSPSATYSRCNPRDLSRSINRCFMITTCFLCVSCFRSVQCSSYFGLALLLFLGLLRLLTSRILSTALRLLLLPRRTALLLLEILDPLGME